MTNPKPEALTREELAYHKEFIMGRYGGSSDWIPLLVAALESAWAENERLRRNLAAIKHEAFMTVIDEKWVGRLSKVIRENVDL